MHYRNRGDAGLRERGIFFLHNPKAGGSALRATLSRIVPGGTIAPTFSNAPSEHQALGRSFENYKGYDFYAGHYGYDVFRRLRSRHMLVTNFREPVSRIRSLYQYWRYNVDSAIFSAMQPRDVEVVDLAKRLSFSEFIRSQNKDLWLYLSNFHFRQLLKSGWEWTEPSRLNMLTVKYRISQMPWFFIAEMPKASMELLQCSLAPEVGVNLERVNESGGETVTLKADDIELLKQMNSWDCEIYGYALRLQYQRLQGIAARN